MNAKKTSTSAHSPDANWIAQNLDESFHNLGAKPSPEKLTELARLIFVSMSNRRRSFHGPSHLVDLVDSGEPILTIAALFHDVVYYQIDQGLPAPTENMLRPLLIIDKDAVTLRKDCRVIFPPISLACDLFNIMPGEQLNPFKNLNEFLSSAVALHSLAPILSMKLLAQVVACIEATIPFRPQREDNDPIKTLKNRLSDCSQKHALNLSEEEIRSAMIRAVELSNRDVKNFASEDPAWFLATTWQLMPERNESLRGPNFTFKDYRSSLEKMSDFFDFLTEDLVFKTFANYPPSQRLEQKIQRTRRNLQVGRTYIRAKLVAINLVEALAVSSGGDLPILDFLGPLSDLENMRARMEQFLPKSQTENPLDPVVLGLLENGLPLESTFDLKNSPLAAYIYRTLGDAELTTIAKKIGKPAPGEAVDTSCLSYFPDEMVTEVARACARVCFGRSETLLRLYV